LVLLSLATLGLLLGQVRGQGRAIPIAAEEMVIETFRGINRDISYDSTNFLVDLSGRYAGCFNIGQDGFQEVDRKTMTGESIRALVGTTFGRESHVNAVLGYITEVVRRWENDPEVIAQVRSAERFGCSVRPGCSGAVSVACLFSPAEKSQQNPPNLSGSAARAFTPQQYDLAEGILGQSWDRSYMLENLSGQETKCGMITADSWPFEKAKAEGERRGMVLNGVYDIAVNTGSTEDGIVEILRTFTKIRSAKTVGCSVIPDCLYGFGDIQDMYIVVSCVYHE